MSSELTTAPFLGSRLTKECRPFEKGQVHLSLDSRAPTVLAIRDKQAGSCSTVDNNSLVTLGLRSSSFCM